MGRDVNMPAMQLHWDIFCRVIDNYGDIGVCWRLARQLAGAHGRQVRLWVDDLESMRLLCPALDPRIAEQSLDGITVRQWTTPFVVDRVADVVIEAFACELHEAYLLAMAALPRAPAWINLEYLTAEAWAESCHGVASPHASLPLIKYFFFPGFSQATGGLLREPCLPLTSEPAIGEISLFCYDNAPVGPWLEALASAPEPVRCLVSPGKPLSAVRACLSGDGPWQLGVARIEPAPFLSQADYDALLRRCAINIVRGEDSFVRAQLAGRPFVWHIYPQEDDAHLDKLTAFLDRYTAGLGTPAATAVRKLFLAWNTPVPATTLTAAWDDFLQHLPAIDRHARQWQHHCMQLPELSARLVKFCADAV